MFHDIPDRIQERMNYLRNLDAADRKDGTPLLQRLRQVPPETGKFLVLIASNVPKGQLIEIGTSGGYSTLWIILSCIKTERKIKTFEVLKEKVHLAKETFKVAQVESYVELIFGDARDYLGKTEEIAFCFLDAEKEYYKACYDLIVPKMVKGAFLIADNAISHEEDLKPMLDQAMMDKRIDSLIVPIGSGLLICRKH